ncbi:MAG: tetratricopeptide repeat protein [bacterium]
MNRATNILFYLGILIVIILELLTGYGLVVLDSTIRWPLFALHMILAAVFCVLFKKLKSRNFEDTNNFALVAFALTAVLPVYGMLGMMAVYITLRSAKDAPREYFATDADFLPERRLVGNLGIDWNHLEMKIKKNELDVEAFADILKTNDRQLEELAVNKLSKELTKNSVNILKSVLKSHTSDTRVLAASALTEMEDKILTRIDALRAELYRDSDNPDATLELARAYDLYCYLGVLDSVSERYYQGLTLEHYEKFLKIDPGHLEANLEYGRILLNAGKIDEAIKMLRLAQSLTPESINPQIWLAEAYYRAEDYQNVRKICQRLSSFEKVPSRVKEVVSWWIPEERTSV